MPFIPHTEQDVREMLAVIGSTAALGQTAVPCEALTGRGVEQTVVGDVRLTTAKRVTVRP